MDFKVLIAPVVMLSSLFYSCQNNLQKEEEARKEVMDLHDEAMPKMERIYELKTTLTKMEDSLVNDRRIESIKQRKEMLIAADEAMMNWMRNFKEPDKREAHEAKMNYYLNEKKKMELVNILMVQSIDSANEEIKKIRNSK